MRLTHWLSQLARRSRLSSSRGKNRRSCSSNAELLDARVLLSATNISLDKLSGNETDETVITVTATADAPVSGVQTVDLAVGGVGTDDYLLSSVTIQIADGDTQGTATFTVQDDSVVEALETATISLTNYSSGLQAGSTTSADVSISDDDTATFTILDSTAEEDGVLTFTVGVSNPIDRNVGIDVRYGGGNAGANDYDDTVDTLTFLANSTAPQQATVSVTDDNVVEATETFIASLGKGHSTAGLSIDVSDVGTGVIEDDDTATFALTHSPASEDDAKAKFTVTLSNPIDIPVDVRVHYDEGSATYDDFDDRRDTISFAPGLATSRDVFVPIINDNVVELTESFDVSLSLPGSFDGGDRSFDLSDTTSGIIADNDTATFTIDDVQLLEGDSGAEFTVELSNPVDMDVSIDVNYAADTAAADDFDSGSDTIMFLAGTTTSKKVVATVTNDDLVELTEAFNASLAVNTASDIGGRSVDVSDTAVGTILDNDKAVFRLNDVTVNEGAGTATLAVSLSNPVDTPVGIQVNYGSGSATGGNTDYDDAPDQVLFPAGTTASQDVTVALTSDNLVELVETFYGSMSVSSSTPLGGRDHSVGGVGLVTITDDDTAEFTINNATVDESAGTATFDIEVSNPIDRTVDVEVRYGSGTSVGGFVDYDSSKDTVTFTQGSTTSQTVSVAITDDNLVELTESFVASLGIAEDTPVGERSVDVSDVGTGTIQDNDVATVTVEDVLVDEQSGEARLLVNLSKPVDVDVTIDVSFLTGSASSHDFDSATQSVTFSAGSYGILPVTVDIENDNIVEATESFSVELAIGAGTNLSGRVVDVSDTAVVTIRDNDTAEFIINDVQLDEDGGTAEFDVTLSNPVDIDVDLTVGYADGSATGLDFDSASDSLSFPAGSTAGQSVSVSISDDQLVELTESFTATLALAASTSLNGRSVDVSDQGTGTILDNDTARFTIGDVTVSEDAGLALLTVMLSNPIDVSVDLDVRYGGGNLGASEYDSTTDTVTFVAGASAAQNVSVALNDDLTVEALESFIASLDLSAGSSLSGRAHDLSSAATVRVMDNDTATFTVDDVVVDEDAGTATYMVALSNPLDVAVGVDVSFTGDSATSGADFAGATQRVEFGAGSNVAQPVTIAIADDSTVEIDEQFGVSLALTSDSAVGARSVNTTDTGSGTIRDNDQAVFTVEDVTVDEAAGGMSLAVSVSNPLDVSVDLDILYAGGTASSSDYDATRDSIMFPGGTTAAQTVIVPITNDNLVELTETFGVSLALGSGANVGSRDISLIDTAIGTILDNDIATFSVNDVSIDENAGEARLTVELSNPIDTEIDLNVSFTDGSAIGTGVDYQSSVQTLAFAAGDNAAQSLVVPVNSDALVELTESFGAFLSIDASTPTGSRAVDTTDGAEVTIHDDDDAIFTIDDITVDEAEGTADFTVSLSNPVDVPVGVNVTYGGGTATGGGEDYDSATDSLQFAAGQAGSQVVSVAINDDDIVELIETFDASLSLASGTDVGSRSVDLSDSGQGTITDRDTPTFTIENVSVGEDAGMMLFEVALTKALDIPIDIDLSFTDVTASGSDYSPLNTSVSFAAGSTTTQTVAVAVTEESLVEATETFEISMAVSSNTPPGDRRVDVSDTATGTIVDNDTASFTIGDVAISENGGHATFEVSLSNPIDMDLSVDVDYSHINTTADDFDDTTDTLLFSSGSTTAQSVLVTVHNDSLAELTETFEAALSIAAAHGRTIDVADTATGTIHDNDTATFTIEDVVADESTGQLQFAVSLSNAVDIDVDVDVRYGGGSASGNEYDRTTDTVRFAAGSTESQIVTVTVVDDEVVEATESFIASLSVGAGTPLGSRSFDVSDAAIGTITDDDVATFVIDDVAVDENNGNATFLVSLSNPIDIETSIDVTYEAGSNLTSDDFDGSVDRVTFSEGTTAPQAVVVPIHEDNLVELAETLTAKLAIAATTSMGDRGFNVTDTAVGTITDNDSAEFTIDDVVVGEDGEIFFDVTPSNPIDVDVDLEVQYTTDTAGADDFDGTTDMIRFSAGSTATVSASVAVTDDNIVELTEMFGAALSLTTNVGARAVTASDTANASITDNDTARFSIEDIQVNETDQQAVLTVSLSNPLDIPVGIDVRHGAGTAGAGIDYDSSSDSLTFAAGENAAKQVVVDITDDNVVEIAESFVSSLALSQGTLTGARAVDLSDIAVTTIDDNDTAYFTVDDQQVSEDGNELTLFVGLSNPIDAPASINVRYGGGSATPVDYDNATDSLSFAAGATVAQAVTVAIHDDNVTEATETFVASLELTNEETLGGRSVNVADAAVISIADDDSTEFTVEDILTDEGSEQATFVISLDNAVDTDVDVIIGYSESDGDFDDTATTVRFEAGSTSKEVSLEVFNDDLVELEETFIATLQLHPGNSLGDRVIVASDSATATITDNDSAVFTISDAEGNESGGEVSFIVSLSNPIDVDSSLDVSFSGVSASAGADFVSDTITVDFAAGSNTDQVVSVPIVDDSTIEMNEVFAAILGSDTDFGLREVLVVDAGTGTIVSDDDCSNVTPGSDIELDGDALVIPGTDDDDRIDVTTTASVVRVSLNGSVTEYDIASVSHVVVCGFAGRDRIDLTGSSLPGIVEGGDGNDQIRGSNADDSLSGGAGRDRIWSRDGNDTLRGGEANDRLYGGKGDDLSVGGMGKDLIKAGNGADTLLGQEGSDTLDGSSGSDVLQGGDDDDELLGGGGDDTLSGGRGSDSLSGSDGDDSLTGDFGRDLLLGGRGKDSLHGGFGEDTLSGGKGQDKLDGGDEADILDGGGGSDTLFGGAGRDISIGGNATDIIDGESGDDILLAGRTSLNFDALAQVLVEWNSDRDYVDRVANIREGLSTERLNGDQFLNSRTASDDRVADTLVGDEGSDWFFAALPSDATDRELFEELEEL